MLRSAKRLPCLVAGGAFEVGLLVDYARNFEETPALFNKALITDVVGRFDIVSKRGVKTLRQFR